jgi:hypothetical protein
MSELERNKDKQNKNSLGKLTSFNESRSFIKRL